MKIAEGNDKLGKGCVVVSRPVGDTCPSACAFLENGCYAEATEHRFPNAREAGFHNLITEKNRIRSMILDASRRGKSIRWHERGDWFKDGEIDMAYVENVTAACDSIVADGHDLPEMWCYSHIYHPVIAELSRYMQVYASVHNEQDIEVARAAGFTLFAMCDSDENVAAKRPRGKAKADQWRKSLPKLAVLYDMKFITCPEIRRGREEITCTGTTDSIECNLCVKGLANVLFPSH